MRKKSGHKLYRVPYIEQVIYCGTIVTEEGKEKKVNIDFEPFKPINTSLYLCDNKFHTEALTALLADDNRFGFIVMDGNGALFGTLQVCSYYDVDVSFSQTMFRATPETCFTSSQWICPRSTAEEDSPRCVSRVSGWRRGTTT